MSESPLTEGQLKDVTSYDLQAWAEAGMGVLTVANKHVIQRRVKEEAARSMRGRRLLVLDAVLQLTCGGSRIAARVSLADIGKLAGIGCDRNIGRELAALDQDGWIQYQPGQGRGVRGIIALATRYVVAAGYRLYRRLQQLGKALIPIATEQLKGARFEHLSEHDTNKGLKVNNPGGQSTDDPDPDSGEDIHLLLDRLPEQWRTYDQRSRSRLSGVIRALRRDGYSRGQITMAFSRSLPREIFNVVAFARSRADHARTAVRPAADVAAAEMTAALTPPDNAPLVGVPWSLIGDQLVIDLVTAHRAPRFPIQAAISAAGTHLRAVHATGPTDLTAALRHGLPARVALSELERIEVLAAVACKRLLAAQVEVPADATV